MGILIILLLDINIKYIILDVDVHPYLVCHKLRTHDSCRWGSYI